MAQTSMKEFASVTQAAESFMAQGQYHQAVPLFRRALRLPVRLFGAASLEAATGLNNLAVACKYLGRLSEARRLYRRAL